MQENRVAPRLKEENNVIITVITGRKTLPKEKIIFNCIKDISAAGANIQTNILLPIGTLLNINFTLKSSKQKINTIGKVKWVKTIVKDKDFETGVEFVNAPIYALQKLEEYILWKENDNKPKSALNMLVKKHFFPE